VFVGSGGNGVLVGNGFCVLVSVGGSGVLDGDGFGVLVGGTVVLVAVGSGVKDGSDVAVACRLVGVLFGVAVTS